MPVAPKKVEYNIVTSVILTGDDKVFLDVSGYEESFIYFTDEEHPYRID